MAQTVVSDEVRRLTGHTTARIAGLRGTVVVETARE